MCGNEAGNTPNWMDVDNVRALQAPEAPKGMVLENLTPKYWEQDGGWHVSLRSVVTGTEASAVRHGRDDEWTVFGPGSTGTEKMPLGLSNADIINYLRALVITALKADLAECE